MDFVTLAYLYYNLSYRTVYGPLDRSSYFMGKMRVGINNWKSGHPFLDSYQITVCLNEKVG